MKRITVETIHSGSATFEESGESVWIAIRNGLGDRSGVWITRADWDSVVGEMR